MQIKIVECRPEPAARATLPCFHLNRGFIPLAARAYTNTNSARRHTLRDRARDLVTFNRDEFDVIQQIGYVRF